MDFIPLLFAAYLRIRKHPKDLEFFLASQNGQEDPSYSLTTPGRSQQKFPVRLEDQSTALGKARVQPMRVKPSFPGCPIRCALK